MTAMNKIEQYILEKDMCQRSLEQAIKAQEHAKEYLNGNWFFFEGSKAIMPEDLFVKIQNYIISSLRTRIALVNDVLNSINDSLGEGLTNAIIDDEENVVVEEIKDNKDEDGIEF